MRASDGARGRRNSTWLPAMHFASQSHVFHFHEAQAFFQVIAPLVNRLFYPPYFALIGDSDGRNAVLKIGAYPFFIGLGLKFHAQAFDLADLCTWIIRSVARDPSPKNGSECAPNEYPKS